MENKYSKMRAELTEKDEFIVTISNELGTVILAYFREDEGKPAERENKNR